MAFFQSCVMFTRWIRTILSQLKPNILAYIHTHNHRAFVFRSAPKILLGFDLILKLPMRIFVQIWPFVYLSNSGWNWKKLLFLFWLIIINILKKTFITFAEKKISMLNQCEVGSNNSYGRFSFTPFQHGRFYFKKYMKNVCFSWK